MSFEDTTQKMADEVATACQELREELDAAWGPQSSARLGDMVHILSGQVEKLARCVARRFPEQVEVEMPGCAVTQIDPETQERRTRVMRSGASPRRSATAQRPTEPSRADGGVCRDCGGITVPTGACSTCTVCGTTGGCG